MDECTFCITFSFTAEGYTESTLIHRGCPAVISRLDTCILQSASTLKLSVRSKTLLDSTRVKFDRIKQAIAMKAD